MLRPEAEPVWAVILALAAAVYVVSSRAAPARP